MLISDVASEELRIAALRLFAEELHGDKLLKERCYAGCLV
jgi:hypothetical protein